MKLELLQENTFDVSEFRSQLSNETYSHLQDLLKVYLKGFKFVNEVESVERARQFHFTNSLLDVEMFINISGKDEKYIMLSIFANVNDRYLIGNDKSTNSHMIEIAEFLTGDDRFKSAMDNAHAFQKTVNEFIDWYMEISGKYGKIKLFPSTYNLIDGYSRGGEMRFIAVAGDFHCERDLSKDKIETRIF